MLSEPEFFGLRGLRATTGCFLGTGTGFEARFRTAFLAVGFIVIVSSTLDRFNGAFRVDGGR
jgi:hypothetical protein